MDTSLSEYPACSDPSLADGGREYTLPDLHGNALKLLNALIKIGMIKMPKHKYKQFLDCYFTDSLQVEKKTLSKLRRAIASIKFVKKTGKLCFIGDKLCDCGSNDYYTLLVVKKLSQLGVHCEYVMSNHGFEFIQGYERGAYTPINLLSYQAQSMIALSNLFSKKIVLPKEVKSMVDKYYKPTINLEKSDFYLKVSAKFAAHLFYSVSQ